MLEKEKHGKSSHMNQDILKRYDKAKKDKKMKKRTKRGQKEDKKMKR